MLFFRSSCWSLVALPALGLSGCLTTSPRVEVLPTTPVKSAATMPADNMASSNNGSLFQSNSYRPLFETPRARMVGDLVTVTIAERITAKQESNSTVEKTGGISASISAFPFMKASQLGKLDTTAGTDNSFEGKGTTESSHTFSGTITATVIEVLPNGHLIIAGDKQIGLNSNIEALRFSGQVDPLSLEPGNVVASTAIANVRIEQRSPSSQGAAQEIGWLGRFFLSVSPL